MPARTASCTCIPCSRCSSQAGTSAISSQTIVANVSRTRACEVGTSITAITAHHVTAAGAISTNAVPGGWVTPT